MGCTAERKLCLKHGYDPDAVLFLLKAPPWYKLLDLKEVHGHLNREDISQPDSFEPVF